jgi:hypothetical protein
MVGQALMGLKTADGTPNFKTYQNILNFILRTPSGILLSLSALHPISRFHIKCALKGTYRNLSKSRRKIPKIQ